MEPVTAADGRPHQRRVSSRYLEHAPVAIAIVEGERHTIVYTNAEFRKVSGLGASDVIGKAFAAIPRDGTHTREMHDLPGDELIAMLDLVRREHVRAREVTIASNGSEHATNGSEDGHAHDGDGDGDGRHERDWRCTVWPVRGRRPLVDQLVIELRHTQPEHLAVTRQRNIAERMLLSALREQALSAENARLALSASAQRVVAEHAQSSAERAQARAEVAQGEAEAANSAKAQFLANMSHELRTPLNAIGGYAQLIQLGLRGPVTPTQVHDLERIQLSQAHLLGLINTILNYAKLEAGRVVYALTDVVLDDALVMAEALIDPQLRALNLEYHFVPCGDRDGSPAMPMLVRADPEKLQQILLNLLTNAIKYTERGGQITLECRTQDGDAQVSVRDTGRGIPRDDLRSIFQPFVQVDRRLHSTETGVGLGLAISRELALGMGGDLTVESVVGVGSTFTLRLPLAV